MGHPVVLAIGGSCQPIVDNCIRAQLALREDRLDVLSNVLLSGLEKFRHACLGQPKGIGNEPTFDVSAAVFGFVKQEFARLRRLKFSHGR